MIIDYPSFRYRNQLNSPSHEILTKYRERLLIQKKYDASKFQSVKHDNYMILHEIILFYHLKSTLIWETLSLSILRRY